MSGPRLRPYQQKAVDSIREAYRKHRSVLFTLPTGGGKTFTFSYMAAGSIAKGKRVLLLVHRRELVDQASEAFRQFGVDRGVIMAGRSGNSKSAQIGMVGTVSRRIGKIQPPDFIIVDEAHHTTASSYKAIIEAFPRSRILGVTATPQRTDGTGLGEIFSEIVIGPSVSDLVNIGALSPHRIFVPPGQIDTSSIKTTRGDFDRTQLASASDRPSITGDAVSHYQRLCSGPAVAFCTSVKHAERVAEHFRGAGITAERVDGGMSRQDRARILAEFSSGKIRVLTSADLISEGFDVPAIEAAILLRPTQSVIIYLQQVGRALRPYPGKDRAIILDHAGNSLRHGMPDDPREWSLEGRKKGEKRNISNEPVTICGDCFGAYRPALGRCPHCGELREQRSRTVAYRDGDLIEITPDMERESRLKAMSFQDAAAQIKTAGDIKAVAKARGYKPGWQIRQAVHVLKLSPHQAAIELGYHPGIVSRLNLGRAA